jgi:hypothetical protein
MGQYIELREIGTECYFTAMNDSYTSMGELSTVVESSEQTELPSASADVEMALCVGYSMAF